MNIALQMDPLESINPKSDTTLLIGIEAQARGHAIWHYTPEHLSWREGKVTAHARRVKFFADAERTHEFGEEKRLDLSEMDVVLLRQDPPFNMAYIGTTYLLERIHPKTLVVNNPAAVRSNAEKWYPTEFMEFMPPTLISADPKEIDAFRKDHKDIVIKPFYGYGGNGVFRIAPEEKNAAALLEAAMPQNKEPVVAQKFLPEVKDQDRRIIIIDGEFAGLVGRIPAAGEIRANFRVGGTAAKVEITPRQRAICAAIGPSLKKQGLLFAGVDVIGDYLTEINITSPTGFAAINRLYGITLESTFWNAVERYIPA
jgi:glutathione synthase